MLYLFLEEIIECLKDYTVDIVLCKNTVPFWKRSFEYTSDNRILDLQEIAYIVKGRIHGDIDGKAIQLDAGGLFWMRSFTPHSLTWEKDLIYFTLRFDLIRNQQKLTIDTPFILQKNAGDMEPIFRNIVYIMQDGGQNKYHREQLKAYFLLLVTYLANHQQKVEDHLQKRKFSEFEKKAIYNYCLSHGFKEVDSNVLSTHLDFSRDYFSRLFSNTFGKSAREWVFEEKIRFSARQLIDSDVAVGELAEILGYDDVYLFSRQFKKVLGLSPKHYRSAYHNFDKILP